MDEVRKLADAVLYEGYVLWPYRRSALKNQKRWTFGAVFPPSHSDEHPDDRADILVECLVEHDGPPDVDVCVRFLQVVERRLARNGQRVDELKVGGARYVSWDEATERELRAGPGRTDIEIGAGRDTEALSEGCAIVRRWEALQGHVTTQTLRLAERLFRITVRIANETPWNGNDRGEALRRAFCSTHVILHAEDGAFVSLTDPPEELRAAAASCENVGVWPVLVGAEGDRHTLLASPIILSDYPQIAPESPGDLFDAGEIDRLLILNVLALTEEEQEEMRAADPRTREILDRCAALGPGELLPLHGVIREFRGSEP
jgi:hydrogenase maturation protease